MNVYIWESSCNEDWSCGDVVVVAETLRKAKIKALKPDNSGTWAGKLPVPAPTRIIPLTTAGVCWYGPGGG